MGVGDAMAFDGVVPRVGPPQYGAPCQQQGHAWWPHAGPRKPTHGTDTIGGSVLRWNQWDATAGRCKGLHTQAPASAAATPACKQVPEASVPHGCQSGCQRSTTTVQKRASHAEVSDGRPNKKVAVPGRLSGHVQLPQQGFRHFLQAPSPLAGRHAIPGALVPPRAWPQQSSSS